MATKPPRKTRTGAKKKSGGIPTWVWIAAAIAIALVVFVMTIGLPVARPVFDEDYAFLKLEEQVAFGPRVPGTAAHQATLEYLETELSAYADRVVRDAFTYRDKKDTSLVHHGTNLIASFNTNPEINRRVMLSAHWDTRPVADKDPDPAKRSQPVLGANDGASGVAVLLELATILHEQPLDFGVDIILFDLEDMGDDNFADYPDSLNAFALGSSHFVEANPDYRPAFGILLDMVGGKDLALPREGFSMENAPHIVDRVWAVAEDVGSTAFLDERGQGIYDDHVPFLQAGIPVIDLIQHPFPKEHHTTADTPDACSAESLGQVGRVLVELLYGGPF